MANAADERTWLLEDEPTPVRLMNTLWADTAGVHDGLEIIPDLSAWLAATSPPGEPRRVRPTQSELGDARELRDALRRLAAHVTRDTRPVAPTADSAALSAALSTVNGWAERQPAQRLTLRRDQLALERASDASATVSALAQVAAEAVELFGGPDAQRLRTCDAPGCVLYFSTGHPRREWCSDGCGNRARAARHYARTRAARSVASAD